MPLHTAFARGLVSDAFHAYVAVTVDAPKGHVAQGAYAYLNVYNPYVASGDRQSLAQIAVADGTIHPNGTGTWHKFLEVGWYSYTGSAGPQLFVFTRDKDNLLLPSCNVEKTLIGWTCDFVSLAASIGPQHYPGDTLTPATGEVKTFSIIHIGSAFYIQYDADYIGYIPDTHWAKPFPSVATAQWQGEVGVASPRTCTDMGNGIYGTQSGAANIYTMTWYFGDTGKFAPVNATQSDFNATNPKLYNGKLFDSGNSLAYGGPGAC
jgi:hypothetical protein